MNRITVEQALAEIGRMQQIVRNIPIDDRLLSRAVADHMAEWVDICDDWDLE